MTDARECDSPQVDVKVIKKVCQLMQRCDGRGGGRCEGPWKGDSCWYFEDLFGRSDIHWRMCEASIGGVGLKKRC